MNTHTTAAMLIAAILLSMMSASTASATTDCFKPIKDYMRGEYQKVVDANGFKTKAECDEYLNEITDTKSVVTRHYFADSQYCFPTLELYGKLRRTGFFVNRS